MRGNFGLYKQRGVGKVRTLIGMGWAKRRNCSRENPGNEERKIREMSSGGGDPGSVPYEYILSQLILTG